jgi:hypothetical protein
MNSKINLGALLLSAVGVLLVLVGVFFLPILFMFSLNVLVPSLAIAFTWKTWLATYAILIILKLTLKVSK